MNLLKVLDDYNDIEELLIENDGELTVEVEQYIEERKALLLEKTDRVVFYRRRLKQEIQEGKDILRAYISSGESKLMRLDTSIKNTLGDTKLKTPLTSLKVQTRINKIVHIFDFDTVVESYPSAVTIETLDNKRTIRISKKYLKEISELDLKNEGFEVREEESSFVDARLRVNKSTKEA